MLAMREHLGTEFRDSDLSLTITKAEPLLLRAPIDVPVQTSFGIMRDRPALFLQVEANDGSSGTGEIWCNFPACGAEHRASLFTSAIFPAIVGREFDDPASCFETLQKQFTRLAIQAGEFGPIAQCIAGLDVALWDLVAKRVGVPLYRLFSGNSATIKTYASGINPAGAADTVARCQSEGYNAFKLKIGFGKDTDFSNLDAITTLLRDGDSLMVDANQAWALNDAIENARELSAYPLTWLEEPLLATAPKSDWQQLADDSSIPLAAGENFANQSDFDVACSENIFAVVQPDLCKWGGFSGALPVTKDILKSGKRFCPHFLGGGVGLLASAHLLASAGGDGCLEIDSNINPLRQALFPLPIENGVTRIPNLPGLGIDANALADLKTQFQVN